MLTPFDRLSAERSRSTTPNPNEAQAAHRPANDVRQHARAAHVLA